MRFGYSLLLLSLPVMGYKTFLRLTGQPFDNRSVPVLVLTGVALFGFVAGGAIFGIEIIRSAIRDKEPEKFDPGRYAMAKPIIPNTGATRLGSSLLLLSLLLMACQAFLSWRGQAFEKQATSMLVLGRVARFGIAVSIAIFGVEAIKSAIRKKDSK